MKKLFVYGALLALLLGTCTHVHAQTYYVIPGTCTEIYWSYTKDRFGRTIERPVCLRYSRPQTIVVPDRHRHRGNNHMLTAVIAGVASYYIIDRSNRRYHNHYHHSRHPHRSYGRCVHQHRNRHCR